VSRYEWDLEKARVNLAKHGVSFDEADTVELDELRRTWPDIGHVLEDERFAMVGYSTRGRLLLVITSERGPVPRIISARRATKRERHAYETRP
jgi:uncharacterized protein